MIGLPACAKQARRDFARLSTGLPHDFVSNARRTRRLTAWQCACLRGQHRCQRCVLRRRRQRGMTSVTNTMATNVNAMRAKVAGRLSASPWSNHGHAKLIAPAMIAASARDRPRVGVLIGGRASQSACRSRRCMCSPSRADANPLCTKPARRESCSAASREERAWWAIAGTPSRISQARANREGEMAGIFKVRKME